jgi:hypothetical protein
MDSGLTGTSNKIVNGIKVKKNHVRDNKHAGKIYVPTACLIRKACPYIKRLNNIASNLSDISGIGSIFKEIYA